MTDRKGDSKMKTCFLILLLVLLAQTANADELIVMTNGMTCWRNANGVVYGCSGGAPAGGSGFNDAQTGTRYEYINKDQAVDTRTGQVINVPHRQHRDKD
jgi:hypothetical protein